MYDYVIVGGGPVGLSLAWYLSQSKNSSKQKMKILVLDENDNIGGCHRVFRDTEGSFTEHGPRVYSDCYVNFRHLLATMNINFYDLFTPYNFSISHIGDKTISNLKFRELLILIITFILMLLLRNIYKRTSMSQFMNYMSFSDKSREYINRLCVLTDGADADRYTLFQFMELANQQAIYKLYQPKQPNDRALFALIQEKLINNGVTIRQAKAVSLITDNNSIIGLRTSNLNLQNPYMIPRSKNMHDENQIFGKNFILSVGPLPLVKLVQNMNPLPFNPVGGLIAWANQNSYKPYICMTLHWQKKIDLPKIWGFPASEWGIAFIVLSDYMTNIESKYRTVISLAVTITDKPSHVTNLTATQLIKSSKLQLETEIMRQLKLVYPDLPKPDKFTYTPNHDADTNFVLTNETSYLPAPSPIYNNLYAVGTYNGNSWYHFTSMESAVSNAVAFMNYLIHNKKVIRPEIPVHQAYSISDGILMLVLLIIVIRLIK